MTAPDEGRQRHSGCAEWPGAAGRPVASDRLPGVDQRVPFFLGDPECASKRLERVSVWPGTAALHIGDRIDTDAVSGDSSQLFLGQSPAHP